MIRSENSRNRERMELLNSSRPGVDSKLDGPSSPAFSCVHKHRTDALLRYSLPKVRRAKFVCIYVVVLANTKPM